MSFASKKTLEVSVVVDVCMPWLDGTKKERAADAFITYMSLDENHKPLDIAPLKVFFSEKKSCVRCCQKLYYKVTV